MSSRLLARSRGCVLVIVASLACLGSCTETSVEPISSSTVAGYIQSDDRLETLQTLLGDRGLLQSLDKAGPYTVFAPSNDALAALANRGISARDLSDVEYDTFIQRHIVEENLSIEMLKGRLSLAPREGADIRVRHTLEGIELDEGIALSVEPIVADNGIIYVLDTALTLPLDTTINHYESTARMPIDGESYVVLSALLPIAEAGYVHDLTLFVDVEPGLLSTVELYLGSEGDRFVRLTPSLDANGRLSTTFADSSERSIAGAEEAGYGDADYRPAQPLEIFRGEPLTGEWKLYVLGDIPEEATGAGELVRWGMDVVVGSRPPPPAILLARPDQAPVALGRGFTEEFTALAYRAGGLEAEIEILVEIGEATSEIVTIGAEGRYGVMTVSVPKDAALGEQQVVVTATAGNVSRVLSFDASVTKPDASGIELLAHVPLSKLGAPGVAGNDIWGWTDSETGAEIALVGTQSGTAFVDVSEPEVPRVLGTLATASGFSIWRDIKVYRDYAFIVSEADDHGLQVFDLRQLRDASAPQTFAADVTQREFSTAHNIVINEDTGFAYVVGSDADSCSGGLLMYDLASPHQPRFVGCFSGGRPDGASDDDPIYSSEVYTHDAQCVRYAGPDLLYRGREICVSADQTTIGIADVTDKDDVKQLSRVSYTGAGYTHQGWLTEDHRYFILNDEFDEVEQEIDTKSYVWDLATLAEPVLIGAINNPRDSIGHNSYVKGSLLFQANYTSGLRIIDLSAIGEGTGTEVAYFDTYPDDDQDNLRRYRHDTSSPTEPAGRRRARGYDGAWSNYPFFASGTVVVSDTVRGLFVLRRSNLSDTK